MANYSIHIKDFSKSFGSNQAVKNLSFDVNEGEIFAFLGTNGSGKTTTIRCLLKIYQADKGQLLINDKEYSEDINNLIGYLPEERGLYKDAKAKDLLIYTAMLRGLSELEATQKTYEYLEQVGLLEHAEKKLAQLSSGMQQKIQLGVTMIHNPEILILDEPFKGLDPLNRQLFIDIFLEKAKNGATILYSTHVIDEAQKMADRLLIIKNGETQEYGSIKDVRQKYGKENLKIEFLGNKPELENNLYSSIVTNNTAEIKPKENIPTNKILEELIKNKTEIISMEKEYPSLNEIFLRVSKDEK
jgi:ABC-2 type transport system ATP-binding protein